MNEKDGLIGIRVAASLASASTPWLEKFGSQLVILQMYLIVAK